MTQGPWKYVPSHVAEGPSQVRHADGWLLCETPSDESARLIAAAPDLLVALEDFDNWFCGFNPDDQASRMEGRKVVIRARAAIAKAQATGDAA